MEAKGNAEGCIRHGPWGYSSSWRARKWDYLPKGLIKKITVWHGLCVDQIMFQTDCRTFNVSRGKSSLFDWYQEDTICFDYHDEYIVSISGSFGFDNEVYQYRVMKSIFFKTNKNIYGPFGIATDTDNAFLDDGKDDVIVGFHGFVENNSSKDDVKHISAIGVYAKPKSLAFAQNSTYDAKITRELCTSTPRMVMPRHPGPWGAEGGDSWDDGVFTTIKQIRVHLGELNLIYVLQFEYLKRDAKSVLSPIHGEIDGTEIELVNLDVKDDEYLIGISGYYGPVEGRDELEAIASIKFHTNKSNYGPYWRKNSAGHVYYSSAASPGKVVGFHGRSDGFLSAIGVHMEYF